MIRLSAYLQNNFGDDLMVKILLDRYPNITFYSNCPIPANNYNLSNPRFLHQEKIYRKYGRINRLWNLVPFLPKNRVYQNITKKNLARCRCSVYIGGSIYMDIPHRTVEYQFNREINRINPAPLFVIGANFGPTKRPEFHSAFSEYFSRPDVNVVFRDVKSFESFPKSSSINYAPDVVFNLNTASYEREIPENTVLISVIDMSIRNELKEYTELYENAIVELCQDCIQKNSRPVLVSFCKSEQDEAAIARILSKLPHDRRSKVDTLFYSNNVDEFLLAFARCSYVIATRFHAMILSVKMKKKFFAISYSNKISCVLDDLSCKLYCSISDLSNISLSTDLCGLPDSEIVDDYIHTAEQQFHPLDAFLKTTDC